MVGDDISNDDDGGAMIRTTNRSLSSQVIGMRMTAMRPGRTGEDHEHDHDEVGARIGHSVRERAVHTANRGMDKNASAPLVGTQTIHRTYKHGHQVVGML
jgi:hypothetical protein